MTPEQAHGQVATGYVRDKLTQLLRDLDNYNAGELWRQMARIAEGGTGIPHAESLARELDDEKARKQEELQTIKQSAENLRTATNQGLAAANGARMQAEKTLSALKGKPTESMIVAGQRYIHSYDVGLIFEVMRDQALKDQESGQ